MINKQTIKPGQYVIHGKRPVKERVQSRKVCGPYICSRTSPDDEEIFFYMNSSENGVSDGPIDLRIEWADEFETHTHNMNNRGWYTDDMCGDVIRGIVARLPHGRGYLSGWSMGGGMASVLSRHVWSEDDTVAAVYEADSMAERVAENEREREEVLYKINETIEKIIEDQTEYAEHHCDAGDAYSFLPRESWCKTDDNRLAEFIRDNHISTLELDTDQISDIALEQFEMVSRHGFSRQPDNIFSLGSYAIGEMEICISVEHELSEYGDDDQVSDALESIDGQLSSDGSEFVVYGNSDSAWCAEIDANTLQEYILYASDIDTLDIPMDVIRGALKAVDCKTDQQAIDTIGALRVESKQHASA